MSNESEPLVDATFNTKGRSRRNFRQQLNGERCQSKCDSVYATNNFFVILQQTFEAVDVHSASERSFHLRVRKYLCLPTCFQVLEISVMRYSSGFLASYENFSQLLFCRPGLDSQLRYESFHSQLDNSIDIWNPTAYIDMRRSGLHLV